MKKSKNTQQLAVSKITFWRILVYFIIYSFLGFIIETIYGMITKGVIESRHSFLYGPFCAIYGLGAAVMIIALNRYKENNNKLFIGGFIVGSLVEYIVSFMGELILHLKWWDYSYMPFNLNGRICIFFSIFWGLLAMYLVAYINPKIDYLIDKICLKLPLKLFKILTIFTMIFLIFDCLVTMFALNMFFVRKTYEYDLNIEDKEVYNIEYEKIYSNPKAVAIINRFFNDKKMIKTFPNIKVKDLEGNIIYFNTLVGDIKPYYYKLNSQLRGDLVNILKHEDSILNQIEENFENRSVDYDR